MSAFSKTIKAITVSISLIACANVYAGAPFVVSGQVSQVEIVGSGAGAPGNFDFRVYLQGASTQCNGSWTYINASDANYQSIVAGILTARSLGLPVSLSVSLNSAGYCQIGYITF